MLIDTDEYLRLFSLPETPEEYERVIRRVYELVLSPGDVVFDIGAHVGKHTFPMAQAVGRKGVVVALEPNPAAFKKLTDRKELLSGFRNLHLQQKAISNTDTYVEFNIVDSRPGLSSIFLRENLQATSSVSVQTTTIDGLGEDFGRPKFIKLDVDGAELLALEGARSTIRDVQPVVHLEIVDRALKQFGCDSQAIHANLRRNRYRIFNLLGDELSELTAWRKMFSIDLGIDVIAVHEESQHLQRIVQLLESTFPRERQIPRLSLPPLQFEHRSEAKFEAPILSPRPQILEHGAIPLKPASSYFPAISPSTPETALILDQSGGSWIDLRRGQITPLTQGLVFNDPASGELTLSWSHTASWSFRIDHTPGKTETLLNAHHDRERLEIIVRIHKENFLETIIFQKDRKVSVSRVKYRGRKVHLLMSIKQERIEILASNSFRGTRIRTPIISLETLPELRIEIGQRVHERRGDRIAQPFFASFDSIKLHFWKLLSQRLKVLVSQIERKIFHKVVRPLVSRRNP